MRLDTFVGSIGTEVIWLFIGSGFALVWGGTTAALALQAGRMSPARLVLGPVLAALVLFSLGQVVVLGWPAPTPQELKLAAMTHAVVNLLGPLSFGPVAAVTLPMCALMGARVGASAPRQRMRPALVLALVSLVVVSVVAGGYSSSDLLYPTMRAFAYLAAGLAVAVALSGDPGEPGAVESGIAASALYPLVVAVGEASHRGLIQLLLVQQAAATPEGKWALALPRMLEHTAPERTGSFVALAVALGVAWLPLLLWGRSLKPGWVVAALLASLAAAAVLAGSDLGQERLLALELIQAAQTAPVAPSAP